MNPIERGILRLLKGRETYFLYNHQNPFGRFEERGELSLILYRSPNFVQVKPLVYIESAFFGDGTPLNPNEREYSFADIAGFDFSNAKKPIILGHLFLLNLKSNTRIPTDREVSFVTSKLIPQDDKSNIFEITSPPRRLF
jgi:hypothetical protein